MTSNFFKIIKSLDNKEMILLNLNLESKRSDVKKVLKIICQENKIIWNRSRYTKLDTLIYNMIQKNFTLLSISKYIKTHSCNCDDCINKQWSDYN